jgi:Mg-chelatase subunit ChlD
MPNNLVKTQSEIATTMISKLRQRVNPLLAQAQSKSILLLDTSSSMGYLVDGGMRRIDMLKNALANLNPGSFERTFAFNNDVREVNLETDPLLPQGGTELAAALRHVGQFAPQNLVLITDGEPNGMQLGIQQALQAAASLQAKINCIFVGDPSNYAAIEFCRQLAAQQGGQFASNPLEAKTIKMLPDTIRLMLSDGGSQDGKGPIAL